jgi:hypothetical protein
MIDVCVLRSFVGGRIGGTKVALVTTTARMASASARRAGSA